MRRKLGILFVSLGMVLLLAALSLFVMNQQENAQAGATSQEVAAELAEYLLPTAEPETPAEALPPPDPYDPVMAEKEVDGNSYIAYLSIPALGLELPVMSTWDYEKLKAAPCRYDGSTKTNDLVIMAHNYAKHFGHLSNLDLGDEVLLTDMSGVTILYEVVKEEELDPYSVEYVIGGDYDLTLFTCTYGGQNRITIRCDRVMED